MRRTLGFLLLAALPFSGAAHGESGVVLGVIDGDTLQVDVGGSKLTVELVGVVTPAPARPKTRAEYFGPEAVLFTQQTALGQKVTLEADAGAPKGSKPSYAPRYVRFADGRDLGELLLAGGLGSVQPPCTRCEEYRKAERKARGKFAGMWNPDTFREFERVAQTSPRYAGATAFDWARTMEISIDGTPVFLYVWEADYVVWEP